MPRSVFERVIALGLAAVTALLVVVSGFDELGYALEHPTEDFSVLFLVPVALVGFFSWVAFTPRRKKGRPVVLIVMGVLTALLVLGALYLVALGSAFRN